MQVYRLFEAHSCRHCCSGNAIGITYSECVLVVLDMQHTMHMRHIVICGLFASTNVLHNIS